MTLAFIGIALLCIAAAVVVLALRGGSVLVAFRVHVQWGAGGHRKGS